MKRKIQKWMIKAPLAAFCLFAIPFSLGILVIYILIDSFTLGLIAALLFSFIIWLLINNAPTKYLTAPCDINNHQCDPYPLLADCRELLTLKLRRGQHFVISLLYAGALRNLGRWEEAEQILSALDIGLTADPVAQNIYYELAGACALHFGREEQAAYHLRQMELIRERVKLEVQKKETFEALLIAKARMLIYQSRPAEALDFLTKLQATLPARQVGIALHYGRAYMALENWELAEMWLNQAVQTGNRLYAVEEAKALLKEIGEKKGR